LSYNIRIRLLAFKARARQKLAADVSECLFQQDVLQEFASPGCHSVRDYQTAGQESS
jgi:hypothetical protein